MITIIHFTNKVGFTVLIGYSHADYPHHSVPVSWHGDLDLLKHEELPKMIKEEMPDKLNHSTFKECAGIIARSLNLKIHLSEIGHFKPIDDHLILKS